MKCEIIKLHNPNQVLSLQSQGSLAILYAPSDTFLEYANACQKSFSDIELIGCSTHMNLTKDGFIADALIVFLSDVEISIYCLDKTLLLSNILSNALQYFFCIKIYNLSLAQLG